MDPIALPELRSLCCTFGDAPKQLPIVVSPLQELQNAYPNADIYIYLNGELAVDFPEDIKISLEPNQMVTAQVVGSNLKLNYCSLDRAIALLREQYAVGTLSARIVRPKPEF